MMKHRIGILLLSILASAGCAEVSLAPLRLWQVCTNPEPQQCLARAPASSVMTLEILGEGFGQVYLVDLDSPAEPGPRGRFKVLLGGWPLSGVELSQQRRLGLEVLRAGYDGSLPPAVYDVQVSTPSGFTAVLEQGLELTAGGG